MSAQAGSAASSSSAAGRRRAALVQQGAHAAAQAQLSMADVQRLRADRSPESRAELAGRFGRQYDELAQDETRPLADAVLGLLVKDVEKNVRRALAEAVAASPNLPQSIAIRLARDEIEVAWPVLERSPVLSDDELGEIVRTHALQYALAVAGRERVSERLADALTDLSEAEVVQRLVDNVGADLSKKTLLRIAEDYRGDREVQDRLIRRPALPYELVDQLVAMIGERLEWELVRARRMTAQEARQLTAAAREQATLSIVARNHGERPLQRELRERFMAGELDPDGILAHLRDGDIGYVETGLALLADTDLATARRLLYGMDKRGLAALCIRAGLATPQYAALRMTLDLAEKWAADKRCEPTYPPETLRFVQEQYERLQAEPEAVASWFESGAGRAARSSSP